MQAAEQMTEKHLINLPQLASKFAYLLFQHVSDNLKHHRDTK